MRKCIRNVSILNLTMFDYILCRQLYTYILCRQLYTYVLCSLTCTYTLCTLPTIRGKEGSKGSFKGKSMMKGSRGRAL